MRSLKVIVKDIARKPPFIMPFIGGAHILWLVWTLWGNRYVPFGGAEWLQALWMVGYTTFWLAACDMQKWGALGYILLTLLNATLYLTVKNINERELYMSNLFLLDAIFSFFLLLFYKQFGQAARDAEQKQ